jgi:hypothetical protein
MRQTVLLKITSLLTLVLLLFHVADDITRGYEKGGLANLAAVPICVVWLCGTLLLAERRSGYVIVLIGSLLGVFVPYVHMSGKGIGEVAKSSGGFFFAWTLLAIGVAALFSALLSVLALWRTIRR